MTGQYRLRDLLLIPNLVSFLRLPLAISFAWFCDRPQLALAVLVAGALTDVLDGFLARKLGQATPTGALIDGVFDKLSAAIVIGILIAQQRVSWLSAVLLGSREVGELPLVVWWAIHRGQRQARAEDPRANWLGKLATVVQFGSVTAILANSPLRAPLVLLTAASGAAAAVVYWKRELRAVRPSGAV